MSIISRAKIKYLMLTMTLFVLGTCITSLAASVTGCGSMFPIKEVNVATPTEYNENNIPSISTVIYDEYFDDAVFVGDSITQGLQNVVIYKRQSGENTLGAARFLAAKSYSLDTAASEFSEKRINLQYQGKSMDIAEALKAMEPGKIFILIGVNDLPCYNINGTLVKYRTMVAKLKEACPDSRLVLESFTPIYSDGQKKGLTNTGMDALNAGLKAIAAENGCDYLDISTPLKDSSNSLASFYTSDKYVHMNNNGVNVWITELRKFAKQKVIDGEWVPSAFKENI